MLLLLELLFVFLYDRILQFLAHTLFFAWDRPAWRTLVEAATSS